MSLKRKIVYTVIYSILLAGVIGLIIRFFSSLIFMDDDGMFIYGLSLMALTSTIVLVEILSSIIASLWKRPKRKKSKTEEK